MLFIVDFDGTIAPHDTVDGLLERFADPAWKDVEEDWVAGRLNSRDCMRAQLALVDADRAVLEEYFQSVQVDPAFPDFIRYASTVGEVAIVSDGIDYPIFRAMERCGVASTPVFSNRLAFTAHGLELSFPHTSAVCTPQSGVCKCAVARALDAGRGLFTVLIGDGRSDRCVARSVDYVFAKDSLQRYCQAEGIAHTPFVSFSDVLSVIQNWDTTHFNLISREQPCRLATR